jgi:hypothetical protein
MELNEALDLVSRFGVPLALLMWRDIRAAAASAHRLELRIVGIETTLRMTPPHNPDQLEKAS